MLALVVQSAGLAPHAAVFATVWGGGDEGAAVSLWASQLAGALEAGAPGMQVVLTPPVA